MAKKITNIETIESQAQLKKPLDFLQKKKFFFPIKKNLVAVAKLKSHFKVGLVDIFFKIFSLQFLGTEIKKSAIN